MPNRIRSRKLLGESGADTMQTGAPSANYSPDLSQNNPDVGNLDSIISMFEKPKTEELLTQKEQTPWYEPSADTRSAALQGAQAGGVSGALTSGGLTSMLGEGGMSGAGPYALLGGLILGQIEKQNELKAQKELQRVADEKAKLANQQKLAMDMSRQVYNV